MTMFNPPHPGEALREDVLPAVHMGVRALARHLGYSPRKLRTVVQARAPLTADLAHRLEQAGLGSARLYLAEQYAYDLWQVEHGEQLNILRLRLT
ncbi:TPA: HigA family addiction module antidote protein [Pseudomonas aeruginosa]|uniref:HigA family addiction module antitoxin n=1 Tax=Pseudomonas aeruginosa TaxID=287 RepID=UPI00070AD4E7|nr:HigA family addiction module antitoxin [Pseudomonas aeruginosa]MBK1492677.1 HigA family addiction module antidote protein [Pseudomonas aeruginosa]HCF2456861.1 HigA family addiction module antidote protein [Pseudomonas aeruginosa]HCI1762967.1 HigA family addiction module antidote protein [Pseudomonas aeruginosa]HCI1801371.1 HigA family addiction module antidote protein [Pseudomonas aeruginosa]HCI2310303.1 HigA family addiction module antidote protein [Pseudomonas aeruginosa]